MTGSANAFKDLGSGSIISTARYNPLGRYLEVKIQLDIYKYGEIAGPHVRGVVNLVSATCAWIPGSRKMNHGTLEIFFNGVSEPVIQWMRQFFFVTHR